MGFRRMAFNAIHWKSRTRNFLENERKSSNEITTTFSSSYTAEISLEEMLDSEILKNYAKQATGQKYLVTPHK